MMGDGMGGISCRTSRTKKNIAMWKANLHSYGPLPVISTYNPIYRMYNPIYKQL